VNTDKENYEILLMGHMDTVFKAGTAAERPFTIAGGKAHGPGVADMKAGLLYIYYALSSLQAEGCLEDTAVCVALNSDEEISSKISRPWLEELSRKSRYALVLEPARANGNLVNTRKGIGRYTIDITGVASHAGVDHEKGRSAISELAHWIHFLHSQTNYEIGTTVNVGMVSGGSAANVVAEQAKAEVDIRICTLEEAARLDRLIRDFAAQPRTAGVSTQVSGGVTRPPMVPSADTLALCSVVEEIAADLGITLGWTATGGGSDGSFAAALGVTTIDGLGPMGGSAHSSNEYLVVDSIEPRFQLLSAVIQHIAAR
jgi:glutamate carboxypeptidase